MVQWWYGHNAVGFFLTAGFLGMMYYFIPKQAGRPVYSYRLSIVHFWALIFMARERAPGVFVPAEYQRRDADVPEQRSAVGPVQQGVDLAFEDLRRGTGDHRVDGFHQWCIAIPGLERRRYAVLCVLAPSLVYWPSSIGKDALLIWIRAL